MKFSFFISTLLIATTSYGFKSHFSLINSNKRGAGAKICHRATLDDSPLLKVTNAFDSPSIR